MTSTYQRPEFRLTPAPTPASTAFWTGGEDGRLYIYRCRACQRYFHPPGPACWRCRSLDVAPEPVSGAGTVATFTINHQPWLPTLPPPYVIVLVALDDEPDVRVMSQLVDVDPDRVAIGDRVQVFFEHWHDAQSGDVWLPLFRPEEAAS